MEPLFHSTLATTNNKTFPTAIPISSKALAHATFLRWWIRGESLVMPVIFLRVTYASESTFGLVSFTFLSFFSSIAPVDTAKTLSAACGF